MASFAGPMDRAAQSTVLEADSPQLDAHGSSKEIWRFWHWKLKDIDWHNEVENHKARAERLNQHLLDIQNMLREKAASLHRRGQSSFNDAIRNFDKPLEMTKALLNEFDAALEKGANSENDCRMARRKLSEMTEQLRAKEDEFNQRQDAQGREILKWKADWDNSNFLKEKAENERDVLQSQKEDLERSKEESERIHNFDVKKLENQVGILRNTIAEQQKAHKSRMVTMKEECDTEIGQLKQEHKAEVEQLRQAISSLKQGHMAELERCEKRHNQELLKLKRDFKQIMSQKQVAHLATEKSLREEIAAYSGALLTRDKNDFNMMDRDVFAPMADIDIEARFADLVQDVDRLSRLDWKPDPKGWTTQELRSLAGNERLLRKQILQDSIWGLLHEFVFCSPFRVFGDQGQLLESQWNKECGTDNDLNNGHYVWPTPQMETERWRYITIRECRAALRQPIPSQFDPRAQLKKGFQASIERLRKGIVSALGDLVVLDHSNLQVLDKMVVRAARTWLDFGLQRCRIVVLVQGSNLRDVEAKLQNKREDGLNLVVVPKLMRFGNSKGESLDTGETIAGREGEVARVGRESKK